VRSGALVVSASPQRSDGGRMSFRSSLRPTHAYALLALAASVAVTACNSDDALVSSGNATVRFVNATNTPMDFASAGVVAGSNGNLTFGGMSSCLSVSPTQPGLTVKATGSSTNLTGVPSNFVPGGKYVVIATTNATGGTDFQLVRTDLFSPGTSEAGVVGVNGVSGDAAYDLYVTAPGTDLTNPNAIDIAYGVPNFFFSVPAGSQLLRFTNTGTTDVAVDAGSMSFASGTNSVIVLGPAATGSADLRTFVVNGC